MSITQSVKSIRLVGGNPSIDFVNTVDPRHTAARKEYLDSYPALVEWGVHAGVEEPARAERLLALVDLRPAQAERVLRRALSLREALYALLTPRHAAHAHHDDALAVLNEELLRAWSRARVVRATGAHALALAPDDELDRVLWPLALAALELLLSPAAARVRECDAEECGWLFLDTSKAGRRRWCSMEVCGNRAKVLRYRERRQAASG